MRLRLFHCVLFYLQFDEGRNDLVEHLEHDDIIDFIHQHSIPILYKYSKDVSNLRKDLTIFSLFTECEEDLTLKRRRLDHLRDVSLII